ncbi:MAG: LAGLIDADG family homing endonuclease [Candidatus Caldarchaeum sp.]
MKKPLDIERIKRFIEHSIECRSAFLRGFFDSEGRIDKTGKILVYNTDLKLLRYVKLL